MTTRTNNNNQQQHYSVNDHDDFEERHGELQCSTTQQRKIHKIWNLHIFWGRRVREMKEASLLLFIILLVSFTSHTNALQQTCSITDVVVTTENVNSCNSVSVCYFFYVRNPSRYICNLTLVSESELHTCEPTRMRTYFGQWCWYWNLLLLHNSDRKR